MPTAKPTNIDAQRILAIMDELKEKLTFLSFVSAQVLGGLQGEDGSATVEILGPELMKCFAEQLRLEDLYVMASGEGGYGHNEETEEMREDVKSLQKNTLELCRKMKAVPNVVQELRNFQDRESRPAAMIQFLKTLADMQELTLKRLSTTVEEEKSRQELLEHYKSREAEASARRQQLDRDLAHIRRECERAQSHRNEILTKLKADLINVKDTKSDKSSALKNKYDQRMKEHQEAFESKREELQKKINILLESNKKLKNQSLDEEMDQIRKAKRYEMDVGGVITRYDSDVKDLAKNYSENAEHLKKEQRQLNDLREHFQKVEEENMAIMKEEYVAKTRGTKMSNEKNRQNEMASILQAYWRGILKREEVWAAHGSRLSSSRRRRRPRRRKVARRSEPSYTAPVPELRLSGMESCPTQGGPSLLYLPSPNGHNSSVLLSGLSISGDLGALPRSIETLELSGYGGYGLLRVIL